MSAKQKVFRSIGFQGSRAYVYLQHQHEVFLAFEDMETWMWAAAWGGKKCRF
jgi:hypothetical protein